MQFNEYHKYTVDEHCIRAVEIGAGWLTDPGEVGDIYRSLKAPKLLHLALLLHDLGKGDERDHSELGAELADATCRQLHLTEDEVEQVSFLVLHHLRMSHLAFYRDMNDNGLIAEFAATVQSIEMLKMLLVLTCSDLAAVGPGVLNNWKQGLLLELYHRTRNQLAGQSELDPLQQETAEIRRQVEQRLTEAEDHDSRVRLLRSLPNAVVSQRTVDEVLQQVHELSQIEEGNSTISTRLLQDGTAVEFIVGTVDRPHSGIFHRITGTLTSARMEILSVDASGLDLRKMVNRFLVRDLEPVGDLQSSRIEKICNDLRRTLEDLRNRSPHFERCGSRLRRT